MELGDFRALVDRLTADIPEQYLHGVVGVEVSARTVPHPVYPTVYTMGECIPVEAAGDPPPSRLVLYHGSFRAMARDRPGFDWRDEAWETLTHELRHHLEWRAQTGELEAYDWAAEQNFRRLEGESFDPLFYLSGERVEEGVYCVDDDLFWDHVIGEPPPVAITLRWHAGQFVAHVPQRELPLYVTLDGLEPPPKGAAILVLRRKPGVLDLFRSRRQPSTERIRVRRAG